MGGGCPEWRRGASGRLPRGGVGPGPLEEGFGVCGARDGDVGDQVPTLLADQKWALPLSSREGSAEVAGEGEGWSGKGWGGAQKVEPRSLGLGKEKSRLTA